MSFSKVPYVYVQYSDEELLTLTKKGNASAFDEIYRRYRNILIVQACNNLPSKSKYMAEDIVQDIFISLYQKRALLKITVSLHGYLVQAIKYKIANEIRSSIVCSKYQNFLFFNDYDENDFSNRLETNELKYSIDSALKRLPPKCKEVFRLSRDEDQSYMDISSSLKISVSTVEKHIVKALKILRNSLNDYISA